MSHNKNRRRSHGIVPEREELKQAFNSFSVKERISFYILFCILFVSTILILGKINSHFLVSVPASGGTITEGVVGTPRFINPILAISDADKDMTELVYAGLMKKNDDGSLSPDMAESYTVSPNGLTYTFTLRSDVYFHDNEKVTADDVIFTITRAKDAMTKSPRKTSWDGVTVQKIDDKTVQFTLQHPYASFLENTTLGILPAHVWESIPAEGMSLSDLNSNPIGSGLYKVKSVHKNASGIPDSYKLVAWKKAFPHAPYITHYVFNFYGMEKDMVSDFKNGTLDQIGSITPENAATLKDEGYTVESALFPRTFALFFNADQNPVFGDASVRKAINMAIDKQRIVADVLGGYGIPLHGPVSPSLLDQAGTVPEPSLDTAQALLAKAGWKKNANGLLEKASGKNKAANILSFSISTSDTPELKQTSEYIKEDLAKIGISVDIKVFDPGTLQQTIIRPRKYEALFFGQVVAHDSDLFAFWHSSQRSDPGLNIALYNNKSADTLLEAALSTLNETDRMQKYSAFEKVIESDTPAIFVYSPKFIYAVDGKINNIQIHQVSSGADRFANIDSWYLESDSVWKIFNH